MQFTDKECPGNVISIDVKQVMIWLFVILYKRKNIDIIVQNTEILIHCTLYRTVQNNYEYILPQN